MSTEEIKTIPIYRSGVMRDDGSGHRYSSGLGDDWTFDPTKIREAVARDLDAMATRENAREMLRLREWEREKAEHETLVDAGLRHGEFPKPMPQVRTYLPEHFASREGVRTIHEDEVDIASLWAIPAELKVTIIKAMGFTPMRDAHTRDCPAALTGHNCNCVPDPTKWSPPRDVMEFMHETWGRVS